MKRSWGCKLKSSYIGFKIVNLIFTCSSPSELVYERHCSPSSEYCIIYSYTYSLVLDLPAVTIFLTDFLPPKSSVRNWL